MLAFSIKASAIPHGSEQGHPLFDFFKYTKPRHLFNGKPITGYVITNSMTNVCV